MMFVKFLLALLPIIWLIVALSRLKMPSHTACLSALAITAVLALSFWKLSPVNTAAAALEGSLNALWPICLVIMAALFTYNLTLKTGAMEPIISGSSGPRYLATKNHGTVNESEATNSIGIIPLKAFLPPPLI